jgi:hypothetical protein
MRVDIYKNGRKVGFHEVNAPQVKTHETIISTGDFIDLFTDDEWSAIRSHTNKKVIKWADMVMSSASTDVESARITKGLEALSGVLGVLTTQRALTISKGAPIE